MGDYETAAGRALDALAEHYGIRRDVESDYALRERLRAMHSASVFTLHGVDSEIRLLFMRVLPAYVDQSEVRRQLAVLWLRGDRPLKWRKRVRWYWRTLLNLMGAPFRAW